MWISGSEGGIESTRYLDDVTECAGEGGTGKSSVWEAMLSPEIRRSFNSRFLLSMAYCPPGLGGVEAGSANGDVSCLGGKGGSSRSMSAVGRPSGTSALSLLEISTY
jgi:hypothetical protein